MPGRRGRDHEAYKGCMFFKTTGCLITGKAKQNLKSAILALGEIRDTPLVLWEDGRAEKEPGEWSLMNHPESQTWRSIPARTPVTPRAGGRYKHHDKKYRITMRIISLMGSPPLLIGTDSWFSSNTYKRCYQLCGSPFRCEIPPSEDRSHDLYGIMKGRGASHEFRNHGGKEGLRPCPQPARYKQ
jgi:hypothetical protein